ncbi:MAG: alpha/beta hydrolase [Bacteroidota bacterium]
MSHSKENIYHYIRHPKGQVAYLKFGEGKETLIALHGFSDRANFFEALTEALAPHYTVYAIDFPFHGATKWEADFFDRQDIMDIFQALLAETTSRKFSLMAYSMGGRITQVILPDIIADLNHLYLIAPDGIDTKWMFNVNKMPTWSIRLIRKWMNRPASFFRILKWLNQKGFLSRFLHDFAYNHLKTPERRDRLFGTWASVNQFRPNPESTKELLRTSQLPTDLYFGERDEVIPPRIGVWLSDGLPNVQLHILDEGHLLLDQELNDLLCEQLSRVVRDE